MRTKRLFFLPLLLVVFSSQAFCFSSKISTLSNGIQKEMISKKTYVANYCPLAPDRLRLVNFSYYDFEGISHDSGKIVVMDAVAVYVKNIFRELYERKFPIEKSKRIEHYDGSDELSLADNNSSCFSNSL